MRRYSRYTPPAEVQSARQTDNQSRIEFAKLSIEQMAADAICSRSNGTIGVEISVKDGQLGKVKRLQIVFQSE